MTRFQARFVQWLTLKGCSLRATAGYYQERYNEKKPFDSTSGDIFSPPGNQVDGIFLRERAIEHFKQAGIDPVIGVMDSNIGHKPGDYEKWRKRKKNL